MTVDHFQVIDPMSFTYRNEPAPPAINVGDLLLIDGREVTVKEYGFGPVTRLNDEEKPITFCVSRWVMSDGTTLTNDERVYFFHAKRLHKGVPHPECDGAGVGQECGPRTSLKQSA